MAKRKRRSGNVITAFQAPDGSWERDIRFEHRSLARRDAFVIAKRPRLPRLLSALVFHSGEDLRRHVPQKAFRPLRSVSGAAVYPRVRFRYLPRNQPSYGDPYRFGSRSRSLSFDFVLPRHAVVCARRRIRKEVMFARNKAGRRGQRRPRRSSRSSLVCR